MSSEDLMAGQQPMHEYVPNRGYTNNPGSPAQTPTGEDDEDYDDIFEDNEFDASEYATHYSDGNMANAYNRHRQSTDPNAAESSIPKTNPPKARANVQASVDDQVKDLTRHAAKIKLDDDMAGFGVKAAKGVGKDARATTEQVLDPRTRMILLQMINRNFVEEVNGCVSTGKEANVYHAISTSEEEGEAKRLYRALKVYKTAILSFKDRQRYIDGEHRFQHDGHKTNNRAMIRQWAEKEFRNLKRVHAAGIPCPEPLYLRLHVILMSFIGSKKGVAAPKLKDAVLVEEAQRQDEDTVDKKWRALYLQLIGYMRIMYATCRLVHGDLSEYNVLYHQNKLWIIDVSQSVEPDHPRAFEFLRMDIKNVNNFFARKGVDVLLDRSIFEFVTSTTGPKEQDSIASALEVLFANRPAEDSGDEETDNAVFQQQFIPQTLEQVHDPERDTEQIAHHGKDSLVYHSLLPNQNPPQSDPSDPSAQAASSTNSDSDSDTFAAKRPRGKRFEDKDDKKAHKQQVKEEKRKNRETKVPKHIKKRAEKMGVQNVNAMGHKEMKLKKEARREVVA